MCIRDRFNIYANWDPYGNTGNVNIAVANLDEGWKDESGEELNMGDGIVESLKAKDTIGWKFVDTKEEALDGVRSGNYYAALVIDEKFTYGMYNGVAENISNPKITYYAVSYTHLDVYKRQGRSVYSHRKISL